MIFLLFFNFVFAEACLDKNKIICETVCIQDGDEKGILVDGQCYCANKRDTSKVIIRAKRNWSDPKPEIWVEL